MNQNLDRYRVRLADVPISKVHLWMLRWVFPFAMAWALRGRRRTLQATTKSAVDVAESVADYMIEARKISITNRRLAWAIAVLTAVNAFLVAYSVLE